jgi:hypothetical protein
MSPDDSPAPLASADGAQDDVHLVRAGDREIWLVGTAHVSQRSVELVREVIERERPDVVCIELDAGRYEALSQEKRFAEQDLREVMRKKQLATLMLNLILASYQRRLGLKLGVAPGSELLEAARVAERLGIPIALCDREVRVTLRRAWRSISWWQRVRLLSELAASVVESPDVSEDELARLRNQDVVSEVMNELGRLMPDLKRVLIDERDAYLAHKILEADGRRVVAVVGAGHVEGMKGRLERGERADLDEIEAIPAESLAWKLAGWSIPRLDRRCDRLDRLDPGAGGRGRERRDLAPRPRRADGPRRRDRPRAPDGDRRGRDLLAVHESFSADRRGLRRGLRSALGAASARVGLRDGRRRSRDPGALVAEPADADLPRLRIDDVRQHPRDLGRGGRRAAQPRRGRGRLTDPAVQRVIEWRFEGPGVNDSDEPASNSTQSMMS